ncbi:hypothetical protein BSLA_02f3071 [Burkholderia stabilis]|nr:hypothetical protein BSLA_02f3071 [Burkholderia stabilis]
MGHGALQRGAHARERAARAPRAAMNERPAACGSHGRTVRPAAARQSTRLPSAFV